MSATITTDASTGEANDENGGFGFFLTTHRSLPLPEHLAPGSAFYGTWCHEWAKENIGTLELATVLEALRRYAPHLANTRVRVRIDNMGSLHILNRGRALCPLQANILREIAKLLTQHNIDLFAEYISTKDNACADFLSRPHLHKHDPEATAASLPFATHIRCASRAFAINRRTFPNAPPRKKSERR